MPDHIHSPKLKQLVGGLAISLIAAVLTDSGVSLFVAIFTLIPIAHKLFAQLNIPWRHYLLFHGIGAMSSGGLDSLPHASGFVNNILVCKLNHRQALITVIIPITVTCAALPQIGIPPGL